LQGGQYRQTSIYKAITSDVAAYQPPICHFGKRGLDFGYWEFESHSLNETDHIALQRGYSCPEAVIGAVLDGEEDTEDLKLRWVPGRRDGSMPVWGSEAKSASEHLRAIRKRRLYWGSRHPLGGTMKLAKSPFSWAMTDPYWYMRPGSDASYIHGTWEVRPGGQQGIDSGWYNDITAGHPESKGGTLYTGVFEDDHDPDWRPSSRQGVVILEPMSPPTVRYLLAADRRRTPGGPAQYSELMRCSERWLLY